MSELSGSKTEKSLREAFAGESQANRRYLAFAKKAEAEGFPQTAKLFRAAAEAETIHAHAHLRVLGGIGTTDANLREAIAGETHEFTKMYPQMIREASEEDFDEALDAFTYANAVEQVHAALFQKALKNLEEAPSVDYYVCQVCGNTVEGKPNGPCEICGSAATAFKKVP